MSGGDKVVIKFQHTRRRKLERTVIYRGIQPEIWMPAIRHRNGDGIVISKNCLQVAGFYLEKGCSGWCRYS